MGPGLTPGTHALACDLGKSMNPTFLVCKVGIRMTPPSPGDVKMEWDVQGGHSAQRRRVGQEVSAVIICIIVIIGLNGDAGNTEVICTHTC